MSQRISYEDLKQQLLSIQKNEHRAFLCTTYAGLARVGEITRNKPGYSPNPPLKKSDIETNHEKQKIYLHLKTEKTGRDRKVPVSFKPRNGEKPWGEPWLCNAITDFLQTTDREELWPYSTRWGEKVFARCFGQEFNQHIHLLRGWRAQHLLTGAVTGLPVSRQIVARMGGWLLTVTLDKYYDHTVIEDYEAQI